MKVVRKQKVPNHLYNESDAIVQVTDVRLPSVQCNKHSSRYRESLPNKHKHGEGGSYQLAATTDSKQYEATTQRTKNIADPE